MQHQSSLIVETLVSMFSSLLNLSPTDVDRDALLLELGADSLILVEIIKKVEKEYSVKLSIRQLFEDLPSITEVARYIESKLIPAIDNVSSFSSSEESYLDELQVMVSELLHFPIAEVDIQQPLLELGADSLIMVELIKRIQNRYNLKLTIRQLFEDFLTVEALANFISNNITKNQIAHSYQSSVTSPVSSEKNIPSSLFLPAEFNLNHLENPDQLKEIETLLVKLQALLKEKTISAPSSQIAEPIVKSSEKLPNDSTHWQLHADTQQKKLTLTQQNYLDIFIQNYIRKTATSKQYVAAANKVMCNSRRSFAMLREQTLPLFYTIHCKNSSGSKFIDVDNNEYIDIAMGFGVHLFGHNPSFLIDDLAEQLKLGLHLGPEHPYSGEIATLLQKITGVDRFTFCNSGTEAVMTAMRIARAATKKNKIVVFKNAYHGHFDATLVIPDVNCKNHGALPMALGTPPEIVANTIVLDFDSERSLNYIQEHAHEIAAVLIEPVQNRRPDLHPKDFLQKLRQVTESSNVLLIFDEILLGFRIHQGGAQAWSNVQADLVTYAKIIGGGLPIAIVGGKERIMAYVDGGTLTGSQAETTYTAGTYIKNPLSVAAARAILKQILLEGPQLQENLNQKTENMVSQLNDLFKQKNVPFSVNNFGSFFRFSQAGNLSFVYRPIELDLFVYHMIYKGIYIWEGGTCFLSTAHTDTDITNIVLAANESIEDLLKGGFFIN